MHRYSGRVLKRTRPGTSPTFRSFSFINHNLPDDSSTSFIYRKYGRCYNQKKSIISQSNKQITIFQTFRYPRRSFSIGASRNESYDDALAALPKNAQLQFDFFGEPTTFLGVGEEDNTTNAMAALDGFLLAIATKGKTCTGGGAEEGIEMKAAHSSAIAWAELLRHAKVWNKSETVFTHTETGRNDSEEEEIPETRKNEDATHESKKHGAAKGVHSNTQTSARSPKFAPMLIVAAVAPIMAQAGRGYVRYLDTLLEQGDSLVPGMGPLQMLPLADAVVARKDDAYINDRERQHIRALEYMMVYDYETALLVYSKILRECPGDVLALSMAMDVANLVGDKEIALRVATSIASYWNDRQGGFLQAAIPGYNISCSWQAVGLAVGGRREEAEQIAERTLNKAKNNCGGVVTWALAHIFDGEGRVAEGISFLANSDGIANYEGSGLMFFDCRLSGYGALYSIDREQRGRGRSAALRLYERNFQRILDYSGFSRGKPWSKPERKAPLAWVQRDNDSERSRTASFFNKMLGRSNAEDRNNSTNSETQIVVRETLPPSLDFEEWDPSCEDVLTWLPPTPPLLAEATLLLFRLTLNGTISTKDARWEALRNAWNTTLDIQRAGADGSMESSLRHFPLACLSASLLLPADKTGGEKIGNGRMASGLYKLGELLKLGDLAMPTDEEQAKNTQLVIADREPDFWLPAKEDLRQEWKEVVDHLASALEGTVPAYSEEEDIGEKADRSLRFQSWDFEGRPIVEHAICYAACRSGDTESLSFARSICSQGVTLRKMSPEEWWRYSIVLGLLGDQVASEDALATSVNIGSGEGQRG